MSYHQSICSDEHPSHAAGHSGKRQSSIMPFFGMATLVLACPSNRALFVPIVQGVRPIGDLPDTATIIFFLSAIACILSQLNVWTY